MRRSSVMLLGMVLSLSVVCVYGHNRAIASSPVQDDTWTVIEYPEGREVVVELKAGSLMPEAKASARITRAGNETSVNIEVSGAAGAESAHQVYAVDSLGNATLLGTLTIADGAGTLNSKTALTKFMIVVSPETDLTAISPDTRISLRSVVPEGFTVVPREMKTEMASAESSTGVEPDTNAEPGTGSDEAEPSQPAAREYDVPLLNIGSLKRGNNSKLRVKLSSGFENAKATVILNPQKSGPTQIKVRFNNLKEIPEGTQYILWQVGPDNSYAPLGHLTGGARKGELTISAGTSASDFGLLITFENADANQPAGSMVAMVIR